MKSDCSKLTVDIGRLQETNQTKMLRKFGMVVDFDEMETYVLRKAVADQEMNGIVDDGDDEKYIKYLEVKYYLVKKNNIKDYFRIN